MVEIPEQAVQAAASVLSKISKRETYHLDNLKDAMNILTAAAPYMPGVKVKQLEWNEYNNGQGIPDRWDAEVLNLVFYSIVAQHDGYRVVLDYLVVDSIGVLDSLEAAKAAAQADFERRVRECIVTEPVDVAAVREQALDLSVLERIAEKAEEFDHPDDLGPYPDIQDAMITVGDLRKLRKLLAAIRQNAEEVIAAKDARIAEYETGLVQMHQEMSALEAENKRLREALEIIDDHALRCAKLVKSDPCARAYVKNILDEVRAALGDVKP